MNTLYRFQRSGKVAALRLYFDSRCEFENRYDGVILYNCQGKALAAYTGTQLAGVQLQIPGNGFYLRLISDSSYTRWGFKITNIYACTEPELTSLTSNGAGAVTLRWVQTSGVSGALVQRAVVNQTTGAISGYTTIKSGSAASAFKDTTAKANTYYVYRLAQYTVVGKKRYYTDYAYAKLYNFKTTTIKSIEKIAMGDQPVVKLTWTPVSRPYAYEVQRSTSANGTYTTVATLDGTQTTYTDTLPQKGVYFYRIKPYASVGNDIFTTAPSVVKAAFCDEAKITSCMGSGWGAVTLKWQSNANATGYMIQRAVVNPTTGAVGKYTTIKTGTGASSFVDKGTKLGVTYMYRLYNYALIGTAKYYSTPDTEIIYNLKTTTLTGAPDLQSSIPLVNLKWTAVPYATRYEVQRSETKDGTYQVIATVTDTSYVDTLPKKAMYYYRVKPYAQRLDMEFTTNPSPIKVIGYPAQPQNLKATGISGSSVSLAWNAVPNVVGYSVYTSTSPDGPYSWVANTTTAKYSHTKARTGSLNYYRIYSYIKVGKQTLKSDVSNTASVFPLTKPVVKGSALSTTSAALSWNAVPNATNYEVYYSSSKTGPFNRLTTTSSTSVTITGLNEMNEYACFYVRAYRNDGGVISYSANSTVVPVLTNKINYRALLIGQTYPGTSSALRGPRNDVAGMANMLRNMTSTRYGVTAMYNLTGSGILANIDLVFGQADCNDVTLLYYSGHGLYSTSSTYLGALCPTDSNYITPDTLRNRLDRYKGKKVIIIDSCHSGNMIGKELEGDTASPEAFNNAFLSAFGNGAKANLATSGYYVITAASLRESSYESKVGTKYFGVFTRALTYGGGWDTVNGKRLSSLKADANRDKKITLTELYNYTRSRVSALGFGGRQSAQIYPSGSTQVVFGR